MNERKVCDGTSISGILDTTWPCTLCGGTGKLHTHGGEKDPDPNLAKQDSINCPKCNN